MARGTQGDVVFVPNRLHVQLAATEEHPGGRVVTVEPGYQTIPDELQDHPVLARLSDGDMPGEAKRRQAYAALDAEYDEAVNDAAKRRDEGRARLLQERLEERQELSEDFDERRLKARERGHAFTEPHPDPETRRAQALTGAPHTFPTAGMAQKPQSVEEPKKTREALPTEAEQKKRESDAKGGNGNRRVKTKD